MAIFPPAKPNRTSTAAINMPRHPSSSPGPSILKSSKTTAAVKPMAGTKRKMMEMDLSSLPSSSSSAPSDAGSRDGPAPLKRARVQFDASAEKGGSHRQSAAVQQQQQEPPREKSVALVREEVRRAIQRHVSGTDSEGYDLVKEIFTTDPKKLYDEDSLEVPSPTTVKRHLTGLLSNISALDRRCSGLVNAVLSSEWLGRDESYVKLFIRFLGNLSAAHSGYLRAVLKMLMNYFGEVPKGTGKLPGYDNVSHEEIYDRVHLALRHILHILPAGSGTLSPILSGQFPFDTDSARANVAYTRNLLKIIDYAPELRAEILALITERLVKIDVQIQVDMEDFEDEVGEDLLEDLALPLDFSTMDDDDDDSDNDSVVSDDDIADVELRRLKTVKDNIRKIDCMIDQLFEYYSPPFKSGTEVEKKNALDLLLGHFESTILPTYRSRHTQFLLFHFAQCSPDLVEQFTTACTEIIFSKTQPAIVRQSAAAYLGSFIARGKHVPSRVVQDIFASLGNHVNSLRATYEATCHGPDLRRYGPFYATVQALLYIFCFRWRDLTTAAEENNDDDTNRTAVVDDDGDDPFEMDDTTFPPYVKDILHGVIHSKFNPLKVCSPPIVTEFARITRHLNFLYVYSILESNKRIRMSAFRSIATLSSDPRFTIVEREIRAGNDSGDQLDAYFPFDPFQLPRSQRWLDGDYIEWRGIPDEHIKAADDDSSDSEEDNDDYDDNNIVNEDDEIADSDTSDEE